MKDSVRLLSRLILTAACSGVVVGSVFATRELLRHQYVAHHLWRTVLWTLSHHTLLGALSGIAVAVFLLLPLAIWKVGLSPGHSSSESGIRQDVLKLATCFVVCAAAAILLAPTEAPQILGLSHWFAVGAALAIVWIIVSGYIDEKPAETPEGGEAPSAFHLLWYQIVGLSCVVAATHIWARALSVWLTAASIGLGLVGAAVVFRLLYHPVRGLAARLRSAAQRASTSGARRIPTTVVALAIALWLAGWIVGVQTRTHASASRMNLIIIAVDTLRWDAVSLLSPDEHSRDLTPNLREKLGSRATVFSRAYSQAPWTLPSFASVFTGLYPEQHKAENVWSRLEPRNTTLAEILQNRGYQTMEVISGHFVSSDVGMDQGFAAYADFIAEGPSASSSAGVTDRAIQFLENRDSRPFFLFAHYFDPHQPYLTHSEIDLGPPTEDELIEIPARSEGHWWGRPAGKNLSALDGNILPYKEEVAFTDLHIGRLLDSIDEANLWENTCVVFVADHGEEFFDHGGVGHDDTLFEELIRVPLAIAAPRLDLPDVVPAPVETRWLFRSLLELLDIPAPPIVPRAPSLLAVEDLTEDAYARSSTRPRGGGQVEGSKTAVWLSSITGTRNKLIEDHVRGRAMCFDLLEDPLERANLSEKEPETTTRLRRLLAEMDRQLIAEDEAAEAPTISEEEKQKLKALGYL